MEALEARGRRAGEAAAARACERLAARLRAEVPEAEVRAEPGSVVVEGRRLWRSLRWIGGMLK